MPAAADVARSLERILMWPVPIGIEMVLTNSFRMETAHNGPYEQEAQAEHQYHYADA
jgi:hypothetical protein